jgi:hypothetical protein
MQTIFSEGLGYCRAAAGRKRGKRFGWTNEEQARNLAIADNMEAIGFRPALQFAEFFHTAKQDK